MVRRVLAALVRRAAQGDLEAVEALNDLRQELPAYVIQAVLELYNSGQQVSYGEIGRWLGVTRQAARQRVAGTKVRGEPVQA